MFETSKVKSSCAHSNMPQLTEAEKTKIPDKAKSKNAAILAKVFKVILYGIVEKLQPLEVLAREFMGDQLWRDQHQQPVVEFCSIFYSNVSNYCHQS